MATDFFIDMSIWSTPNTYDTNFKYPSKKSGVYILVKPTFSKEKIYYEILYVGSSKQLNIRYSKHEVLNKLQEYYGYIQFYFKETENYVEEEKMLIKEIQPKYNKQWL